MAFLHYTNNLYPLKLLTVLHPSVNSLPAKFTFSAHKALQCQAKAGTLENTDQRTANYITIILYHYTTISLMHYCNILNITIRSSLATRLKLFFPGPERPFCGTPSKTFFSQGPKGPLQELGESAR